MLYTQVWTEALERAERKGTSRDLLRSTSEGGTTGFWVQKRNKRLILAIEMPHTSAERSSRLHRVLRPTLHTSAKPMYVPGPELIKKYAKLTNVADAEDVWRKSYETEEDARVKDVRLLSGCVIPIWPSVQEVSAAKRSHRPPLTHPSTHPPLTHSLLPPPTPPQALLKGSNRRQPKAMPVQKCLINGNPTIGVSMTADQTDALKEMLQKMEGGREEEVTDAQGRVDKEREWVALRRSEDKAALTRQASNVGGGGKAGGGGGGGGGASGVGGVKKEDEDESDSEEEEEEEPELSFAAETKPSVQAEDDDEEDLDALLAD